jgi:hypothetical protein
MQIEGLEIVAVRHIAHAVFLKPDASAASHQKKG